MLQENDMYDAHFARQIDQEVGVNFETAAEAIGHLAQTMLGSPWHSDFGTTKSEHDELLATKIAELTRDYKNGKRVLKKYTMHSDHRTRSTQHSVNGNMVGVPANCEGAIRVTSGWIAQSQSYITVVFRKR